MKTQFRLLLTAALLLFVSQIARADEAVPLAHFDHSYERVEKLFAAVPSGATLDQARYEPAVGADVADYLKVFHINSITSLDGAVTLHLPGQFNGRTPSGTRIQLDQEVRFSYRVDQGGRIICENASGIRIKAFRIFGWMQLKGLIITKDAAGNTVFEAKVDVLGITITKTKTVTPDGQVQP